MQELANGSRRARIESAADGRYVASGHIVYLQRGTTMAAPFDVASLKVTGGDGVNVDGRNTRSSWSPDGTRIAFSSTVAGVKENAFLVSADGSGTPDRLMTCDCPSHAASWTPDGRTIVGVERRNSYDIVLVDVAGTHQTRPLLHGRADEYYPDVSPDGHWIAYASNESGRNEVYVQPFPGLGSRHQISSDGGTAPAWSRDGRELFYTTTAIAGGQTSVTRMMAVAVRATPTFTASPPRVLFEGRYGATAIVRPYDVSPDGQRFLMVKQKDRAPIAASQMILVQNWLEDLKARLPPK